jgi:hypothetical protein
MSNDTKSKLKWLLIGAILASLCLFGTPTKVMLARFAGFVSSVFGSIADGLR